jgi:hypothetical protein
MPTNWKSLVEKQNASTFVLPDGWDSKADIALQLECSEEKVDDYLRPALKSGKVLKQVCRVWDAQLKRVLTTVAYHDTAKDGKPDKLPDKAPDKPAPQFTRDTLAEVQALKDQHFTWREIGQKLGITSEAARSIYRKAK